jgi:predicted RNA polymerase sigma factor
VSADARIEDLLRTHAPQVLGALVRRHGQFDACEDAVQDALLAATLQWLGQGVPDDPTAWLTTDAALEPPGRQPATRDDTLTLLFLCCHPSLSVPAQLALTLRAVGGLTTAQIANAFLVPEATMAQRISRAKQRIRTAGIPFDLPPEPERADRLGVVLHALYLVFNEGYVSSAGAAAQRVDLTAEAIRLARLIHRLVPADGEVAGLVALLLLTDARRPARTAADGMLVPLDEQRRDCGIVPRSPKVPR